MEQYDTIDPQTGEMNEWEAMSLSVSEMRKELNNLKHEFITLKNKVYSHVNQIDGAHSE